MHPPGSDDGYFCRTDGYPLIVCLRGGDGKTAGPAGHRPSLEGGAHESTASVATLLLCGFMVLHGHASAQSAGAIPENLDSLINSACPANYPAGIMAAIIKDNKIAWMRPYGWADIPNRIPWRPYTIHRVASISKTMMQAAFMQLVERHMVSLDDSVNSFLPFLWSIHTFREFPSPCVC